MRPASKHEVKRKSTSYVRITPRPDVETLVDLISSNRIEGMRP